MNKIKVAELFAGVGGFRLGLEKGSDKFKTIWANQWEPNKKNQFAYEIYKKHWNDETCLNEDIKQAKNSFPEAIDLLVGGFPCQDFSVAVGNRAKGITGEKGELWWEIEWILKNKSPNYFLLENVDRILKMPTSDRGRDFAIILSSLNEQGYDVEWKVIKASDYGFAQKRKRIFIWGVKRGVEFKKIISQTFPHNEKNNTSLNLNKIKMFKKSGLKSWNKGKFLDYGFMVNGKVEMFDFQNDIKDPVPLKNILLKNKKIDEKYYLTDVQIEKAKDYKFGKSLIRTTKEGFEYKYTEGKMSFPDNLENPARTLLTAEGKVSRTSHFIKDRKGFRTLHPIEAERINGFDDNWTEGITDSQRFFTMGNALVVGIIEKLSEKIEDTILQS